MFSLFAYDYDSDMCSAVTPPLAAVTHRYETPLPAYLLTPGSRAWPLLLSVRPSYLQQHDVRMPRP